LIIQKGSKPPVPTPACWVMLALVSAAAGISVPETAGQQPSRSETTAASNNISSNVNDPASLFDAGAVDAARKELSRIERATNVATVIETVESLNGQKIAEVATRAARHSEIQGVFILIAKNEKAIELLVSKNYFETLPRARQDAIRGAFIAGFKKRDFDDGLRRGVAAIGEELSTARRDGRVPDNKSARAALGFAATMAGSSAAASPLVVRSQVRIGLAGARVIISAAEAMAIKMDLKLNLAVVDDGGHLVAFERMDGARLASLYVAITQATWAATFRQATGPLAAGATPADPLLNLSLQNAAQASGAKLTVVDVGVPILIDGQTIGAIGVSGGTGEQDAQVAARRPAHRYAQSRERGKEQVANG
jgi:glc operon protein GlcG